MSDAPRPRDIQADYKAAMIEEYEAYVRAGRAEDAKHVASVLKYTFDYEPAGEPDKKIEKKVEPAPPVERAVPDGDDQETPETPEQPVKRGPGRPRKNVE